MRARSYVETRHPLLGMLVALLDRVFGVGALLGRSIGATRKREALEVAVAANVLFELG